MPSTDKMHDETLLPSTFATQLHQHIYPTGLLPPQAQNTQPPPTLINRLLEPHDSIPSNQPINALLQRQHTRPRLLHVRAVIGNKHETGLLDRVDESRYKVEESRSADEAHEIVRLGDADGFFDRGVGAAAAGDYVGVVGGGGGDAEFVAEEDWVWDAVSDTIKFGLK